MKSKRMRWTGHVACVEGKRTAYRVFLRKPEGKRALGRCGHMWVTFKWILKK
jgi:hypothetical protein